MGTRKKEEEEEEKEREGGATHGPYACIPPCEAEKSGG